MNTRLIRPKLAHYKWYDDYRDQLTDLYRDLSKNSQWIFLFALLVTVALSYIMIFLSQSSYLAIANLSDLSASYIKTILLARRTFFILMWTNCLVAIVLLFFWALFSFLSYIAASFFFELAYRIVIRPSNHITSIYVSTNISFRKGIQRYFEALRLVIIIAAVLILARTILVGKSLHEIIDIYAMIICVSVPSVYVVTYFFTLKKYRTSNDTDRKNIQEWLFSRYAVHKSFISFVSTLVFLGLLGYYLIPGYLFLVSSFARRTANAFMGMFNYRQLWPTIQQVQISIDNLGELVEPEKIEQSINWIYLLTKELGNKPLLLHLQKAFFVIMSVLSFFMVAFKGIMNLILVKGKRRYKKILFATIYTVLATSAISVILRYLFFIDMSSWSIYAIVISLTLNFMLTAQTT